MAESIVIDSSIDGNEFLRDSLEISVEERDNSSFSGITRDEIDLQEPIEERYCMSSPYALGMVTCDVKKEQKPKTESKKSSFKSKTKNMVEFNKMHVTNGQTKNSYSIMHRKKLGKTSAAENEETKRVGENPSSSRNYAAIALRKQLVLDGILTDKDENTTYRYLQNCGVQETNNRLGGFDKDWSELTRFNETNMSKYGNGYFIADSNLSQYPNKANGHYMQRNCYETSNFCATVNHSQLPPVSNFPSSVQSAPADTQAHEDMSYEKSPRSNSLHILKAREVNLNNSMTSLASTMTYSSIYASTKENGRTNYKPYTLGDYKQLKKECKLGGLGPDTNSEEHQEKAKKAIRQKEYSVAVKQRNRLEGYHDTKKKRTSSVKEVSAQKQEAIARRMKALEYAKSVPKPVTSKNHNVWRTVSEPVQEPQSLLDILQQRHEDEKKAIDAMRKDLKDKLKTR